MLSRFSVKKPYTVAVAVILVIILGFISFTNMTVDLFPKMSLPYAVVITAYPGASPEQVEQSVTAPIEKALLSTGGVQNVQSVSSQNTSMVILEFAQNTNMDSAIIELNSSLEMIDGALGDSVGAPMLMQLDPDMLPVMVLSADIEGYDKQKLSTFVSDTLVPALERIGGVASVNTVGLAEKQLTATLNDSKIKALDNKLLETIDSSLHTASLELEAAQNALDTAKAELDTKTNTALKELDDNRQKLSSALSQLHAALAVTSALGGVDTSAVKDALPALDKAKGELAAAAQKLSEIILQLENNAAKQGLVKLKESITSFVNSLENIHNSISGAVNTDISEITAQLNAKITELSAALGQLDSAKNTLIKTQADSAAALAVKQSELEGAKTQFEQNKESAYKAAGLGGTLTKDSISALLLAQNFSMPAGYVGDSNSKYSVAVQNKAQNIDELNATPLIDTKTDDIGIITLGDIADVQYTTAGDDSYAKINGNDGVLLWLQKQSTYSTTEVSNSIHDTIKTLESENKGLSLTPMQDQGVYINIVVSSVLDNLIMGGVLAVLILLLFLRSARPTIIVALSIPISVTFALVLMYFSGVTLNLVSLSGLALGVGMLVDNSIVVIENTFRLRALGLSAKEAAVKGATGVAGAIFASTLTTVCVFLPIVFTEGMTRQLFTDMGLTIAYSLLASLVVALTLAPAMSSLLLTKPPKPESRFARRLSQGYSRLIALALRYKAVVLIAALLLFGLSIWRAFYMGTALIPQTDSTQLSISLQMPEGATKADTRNMADHVMERIAKVDGVKDVAALEMDSMMGGGNEGGMSMYVTLDDKRDKSSSDIAAEIENSTKELDCTVKAAGSSVDMSALGGSGIELVLKGDDLETLKDLAQGLKDILSPIAGVSEIKTGLESAEPMLIVEIDGKKALQNGLTTATAYQQIAARLSEAGSATTLIEDGSEISVVVKDSSALTRQTLMDIPLTGGDKTITLSDIAGISEGVSPSSINHSGGVRTMTVSAGIDSGHNIGLVSRDVAKSLESFELPDGYTLEQSGENETIQKTMGDMFLMLLLAVVCIYLIMVAQFQSLLSPFIVMFTIPLAFTGGLLALQVTGMELSVIALLGFLVLSGVVVNNGIVLIDYINQLRAEGMAKKEAIIQSALTRLRPILMTALTTILGLTTMALGLGSGADMVQPLAVVTIGGLAYATLLTLFVVPCLYDLFNRKKDK